MEVTAYEGAKPQGKPAAKKRGRAAAGAEDDLDLPWPEGQVGASGNAGEAISLVSDEEEDAVADGPPATKKQAARKKPAARKKAAAKPKTAVGAKRKKAAAAAAAAAEEEENEAEGEGKQKRTEAAAKRRKKSTSCELAPENLVCTLSALCLCTSGVLKLSVTQAVCADHPSDDDDDGGDDY